MRPRGGGGVGGEEGFKVQNTPCICRRQGAADLMGQAPCRRPPKVDFGESILEIGSSRLENYGLEARFWMKK